MDDESVEEKTAHQIALVREYKKHLIALELQAAKFGVHVPSYIQIEIDNYKEMIKGLEDIAVGKGGITTRSAAGEVNLLKERIGLDISHKVSEIMQLKNGLENRSFSLFGKFFVFYDQPFNKVAINYSHMMHLIGEVHVMYQRYRTLDSVNEDPDLNMYAFIRKLPESGIELSNSERLEMWSWIDYIGIESIYETTISEEYFSVNNIDIDNSNENFVVEKILTRNFWKGCEILYRDAKVVGKNVKVDIDEVSNRRNEVNINLEYSDFRVFADRVVNIFYGCCRNVYYNELREVIIEIPANTKSRIQLQWKYVWQNGFVIFRDRMNREIEVPYKVVIGIKYEQTMLPWPEAPKKRTGLLGLLADLIDAWRQ